MSGTSANNGTFLVLTHDLQCRDLDGVVVRLAQNTMVRVSRIKCLPGWSILENAEGRYAPVRDENVVDISVPARPNGYPAFAPMPPADSTKSDTIEAEPTELIVVENVVVCESNGRALWISSGSVVSIIAHNPNTFAWFKTVDGRTFVVDPRRPVKMRAFPAAVPNDVEGSRPEDVLGMAGPALQLNAPGGSRGEEAALKSIEGTQGDAAQIDPRSDTMGGDDNIPADAIPYPQTPTLQLDAITGDQTANFLDESLEPEEAALLATGAVSDRGAEGIEDIDWNVFTQSEFDVPAAYSEADLANLARTVQATPTDFTQTDVDFCSECLCFTFDHAADCVRTRWTI